MSLCLEPANVCGEHAWLVTPDPSPQPGLTQLCSRLYVALPDCNNTWAWHDHLITSHQPYFLFHLFVPRFISAPMFLSESESVEQVLTFPLSSDQSAAAAFHMFWYAANNVITVKMLTNVCCLYEDMHRNFLLTVCHLYCLHIAITTQNQIIVESNKQKNTTSISFTWSHQQVLCGP